MIFVGVVSILSVVTLRDEYAASNDTALASAASALIAVKDWTFLLGPGLMAVVNALCLATVLYQARLVPRAIPAIGLVGAPLLLASFVATLFGAFEQVSVPALILALPIAVWEFSLGMRLTIKGFSTTTQTVTADTTVTTTASVAA